MASKIGTFLLDGPTYLVELAPALGMTAGGSAQLKNLGPDTAWLVEMYASDSAQSPPPPSSAWPLAPGEAVTLTVPVYPVAADERVPGLVSSNNATTTRIAFIAEGF